MRSSLQIGEVSKNAGVSVDAVRYYERLKLLPGAVRSAGGFRLFPSETVDRIRFIKEAQEMGFSLDEVKQLLAMADDPCQCETVRQMLLKKLAELRAKMDQMQTFTAVLTRHLEECNDELKANGIQAACPVLTAINAN